MGWGGSRRAVGAMLVVAVQKKERKKERQLGCSMENTNTRFGGEAHTPTLRTQSGLFEVLAPALKAFGDSTRQ